MTTISRKTTKLFIPHPDEAGVHIVGILEQHSPREPIQGRKIALILHGTMGHKDYLFQKELALRLPLDSFRFDFRGNDETGGEWRPSAFLNDVADIEAVVEYLSKEFGYTIDLVVAHSRGAISAFRWMCTSSAARSVEGFVNISGRYQMDKISHGSKANEEALQTRGYYDTKCMIHGKPFIYRVTQADVKEHVNFDTSYVLTRFPPATHVLTIHGSKDRVIPVFDASIYARALSARSPGTHSLCIVEGGCHRFIGMFDIIVSTILDWWIKLENGQLKTGNWKTSVKGKL